MRWYKDYNTPRQMLWENFLGVNTNVAPQKPARDCSRQPNIPEVSTTSNDTDDGEGDLYFAGSERSSTSPKTAIG